MNIKIIKTMTTISFFERYFTRTFDIFICYAFVYSVDIASAEIGLPRSIYLIPMIPR